MADTTTLNRDAQAIILQKVVDLASRQGQAGTDNSRAILNLAEAYAWLVVPAQPHGGQATQTIYERERELRIQAGTLTGVAAERKAIAEPPAPKLLDQVLDVFAAGEARLWSETIVARLAERDPDRFGGWNSTDLANALRPYGVTTAQVWAPTLEGGRANRRGVAREAVLEALRRSLHVPTRRSRRGARDQQAGCRQPTRTEGTQAVSRPSDGQN